MEIEKDERLQELEAEQQRERGKWMMLFAIVGLIAMLVCGIFLLVDTRWSVLYYLSVTAGSVALLHANLVHTGKSQNKMLTKLFAALGVLFFVAWIFLH